jgi:anti-anti-sigma regulatory factor
LLCLAGEVDAAAVEAFVRRYGREPARIDGIDAASVTGLGAAGVELLLDTLDVASRASRPVRVRCSPVVERLLAEAAVQT